jgi:hypothetical protein
MRPFVRGTSRPSTLRRSPDRTMLGVPLTTCALLWPTQYKSSVFHSPCGFSLPRSLMMRRVCPTTFAAPFL